MKEYKNTRFCIFCGNNEIQKAKQSKSKKYKKETLDFIFIKPLDGFHPVCKICQVKHLEPAMEKYPLLF